jgi:uncharacterized cupredoxin-like copper-binding protein
VQAFSRYYTHEGLQLEPRGNGRTDSQGRYRIAALAAGNYFVQAMKAVGPVAYSGTFYPGSADVAGAKPVNVLIGRDVAEINLRLKKSPGYRVAGKLMDIRTDTQVKEAYTVTVAPEIGTSGVLATIAKDGSFEFASLIPGRYRLTATMTDLRSGASFKVMKNVEVKQADLTDLVVKIGAGATVRVKATVKAGEMPRRLALALVRREDADDPGRTVAFLRASQQDLNSYEFRNVSPGEYLLILGSTVSPDMRRFFLEEVTEETKDVQETGFVVPEGIGAVQLSAVVNMHGGTIKGTATDSKKQPLLGRAIVVVAADRAQRQLRHYSMVCWTDSLGAFSFTGIIPGDYLAVLWSGSDPGEAQNPALFDEVERNGARIHVAPDAETNFGLKTGGS